MSIIASGLLLLALTILAVIYPPAIASLNLLVASPDTPAIGVSFTHFVRIPVAMIHALTVLAVCSALWKLRCAARTAPGAARKLTVAKISIGVCIWIGLSVFAVTGSMSRAVLEMLSCGVYGVVLALAYHRSRSAMILLLTPVVLHLLLSLGITYLPGSPLAILRPMSTSGLDESLFGVSSDGITRVSAQFNNAVPLSFHAAAAMTAGIYMVLSARGLVVRLLGSVVLGLGVWVSYMTVERAIWVGIIVGAFVLLLPIARRSGTKKIVSVTYFASVLLVVHLLVNNVGSKTIDNLGSFFLSAGQASYRLNAAVNSVDILLSRPGFGTGGDVTQVLQAAGGLPHQSFYSTAVLYGIPAGLGVLLLGLLGLPFGARTTAGESETHGLTQTERTLALAVGCIVVAMALSNNMSAGMLGWICLGFACLPRIYRRNSWSSHA